MTWESKEVSQSIELFTVTVIACTGIISCTPNAVLSVSPVHPRDFDNCKRWPHLPFYNDWQLYIRWKVKFFLRRNQEHLACGDILVEATKKASWEAEESPVVVALLVPGDDFIVTPSSYLHYQNPKLSRAVAGVDTLQDEMEKRAARHKRVATEDAREAEFLEKYKQWERDAYRIGKQITKRTNGTKETQEMNFARFGYNFAIDPRFNGEHKALGYDGVGDDPCDHHNHRS